jgi:hypothetical protein
MDAMEAAGGEIVDPLERVEALYGLFKPVIHLRQRAVSVGLYRHEFGFGVRTEALGFGLRLREVDGAFSFVRSHICLPPSRRIWLGRVRCSLHRTLPDWFKQLAISQ